VTNRAPMQSPDRQVVQGLWLVRRLVTETDLLFLLLIRCANSYSRRRTAIGNPASGI
jgi:hypothetical protein